MKTCVSVCTVRGFPFSFFSIPEIKYLISPLLSRYNITLNEKNIVHYIDESAVKIKNHIREEVKGKIICLKVDAASRFHRKFIGVSCQFIANGKLTIRYLTVVDFNISQKSMNLKTKILRILEEFGIPLTAIGSITTDNGANMLKMSELLHDEQNGLLNDLINAGVELDESNASSVISMNLSTVYDLENMIAEQCPNQNESTENPGNEIESEDEICETIQKELSGLVAILVPIRCASHTFHLAVLDVLTLPKHKHILETFRSAAKILNRVQYRAILIEFKIKKVPLDVCTRWGSSYLMVSTLLENKHFYFEHDIAADLGISDEMWETGKMFIDAFKPMFLLIKRLQEQNFIISDLFKQYLELQFSFEQVPETNIFINDIKSAVEKRKCKLFENKMFLAGLFLDPRFNFKNSPYFPPEKIAPTLECLVNLWGNIKNLEREAPSVSDLNSVSSDMAIDVPIDLESFIGRTLAQTNQPRTDIENRLQSLSEQERQHSRTDVLSYYNSTKQYCDPDLYKLACAVYGTAASQVTIERGFSALPIILNKYRSNLSPANLSNILLVRLNRDLLNQISFDRP